MSSPAPDREERLKRSALAWEMRKYRMESKAQAEAEAARLALDRERFEFDRQRAQRENSFGFRLMPTLVTSCTAVAGALVGFAGVLYQQNAARINNEAQSYITAHLNNLKPDALDQTEARANILKNNPPNVAQEIFRRLAVQSSTPAGRIIWDQGQQVAGSSGTTGGGVLGQSQPATTSGTVYVQYKDPADVPVVNNVIAALTQAGYYVSGKQKVVQATNGDVRYYAAATDNTTRQNAEKIADIVQQTLKADGKLQPITPINLHDTFPKMPSTTFEVWIPALSKNAASPPNSP